MRFPDDSHETDTNNINSSRDENIRYLSSFPTVLTGVGSLRLESVDEVLERYSDELLSNIVAATEGEQEAIWMVHRSIGSGLPESTVREWLAFSPLLSSHSYLIAKKLIASLHDYQQEPESTGLTAMGDQVMNECKALLLITQTALDIDHEVFRDEPPYFIFKDERFAQLIFEYQSEADRISRIMIERQSVDPDTIRTVLESDTVAMSSGAL